MWGEAESQPRTKRHPPHAVHLRWSCTCTFSFSFSATAEIRNHYPHFREEVWQGRVTRRSLHSRVGVRTQVARLRNPDSPILARIFPHLRNGAKIPFPVSFHQSARGSNKTTCWKLLLTLKAPHNYETLPFNIINIGVKGGRPTPSPG